MPVIDLIIRIKNGYMSKKNIVVSPYSKFREAVVKKLLSLHYISNYNVSGDIKKTIEIGLKYEDKDSFFTDVKIFSTPGRRVYLPYKDIKSVKGGMGHAIISSSKGILTDKEARKSQVGGELLFHIW